MSRILKQTFREPNGEVREITAPDASAKAVRVVQAVGRVVRALANGEPVRVSSEERERRLAICRSCEFWREAGNLGFGECKHSKCGCTRLKHGLATETCPLGKWELTPPTN